MNVMHNLYFHTKVHLFFLESIGFIGNLSFPRNQSIFYEWELPDNPIRPSQHQFRRNSLVS